MGYGKSDVSDIEGEDMQLAPARLISVRHLPRPRALERRVFDVDGADPSDGHHGEPAEEGVAGDLFRRNVGVSLAKREIDLEEMGYGITK